MLPKYVIVVFAGIPLICIAALILLAAGLFAYDKTTPGIVNMSTTEGVLSPQKFGKKVQSPIYTSPDLTRQLVESMQGIHFEKQCQDRATLVKRFYDLGAENVWVQRELQPLQVYIQLPDDATLRQAIIDRVAAECACGDVASHHHFLAGDGFVVVGLVTSD